MGKTGGVIEVAHVLQRVKTCQRQCVGANQLVAHVHLGRDAHHHFDRRWLRWFVAGNPEVACVAPDAHPQEVRGDRCNFCAVKMDC